jgi:hypothetical protein
MTPLSKEETVSLLQTLSPKIQDLVIEHNLKKDSGPLRSAWEQAILRGRRLFSSSDPQSDTQSQVRNFWEASAESVDITPSVIDGSTYCVIDNQAEETVEMKPELSEPLPSPRPSPPRSVSPNKRPMNAEERVLQDFLVD